MSKNLTLDACVNMIKTFNMFLSFYWTDVKLLITACSFYDSSEITAYSREGLTVAAQPSKSWISLFWAGVLFFQIDKEEVSLRRVIGAKKDQYFLDKKMVT